MGQDVTIPKDQHFSQYFNSLIPHNKEETSTPKNDITQFTSTNTSCSIDRNDNHSSTSTKGKEKVGCSSSSLPSPSSSNDPK